MPTTKMLEPSPRTGAVAASHLSLDLGDKRFRSVSSGHSEPGTVPRSWQRSYASRGKFLCHTRTQTQCCLGCSHFPPSCSQLTDKTRADLGTKASRFVWVVGSYQVSTRSSVERPLTGCALVRCVHSAIHGKVRPCAVRGLRTATNATIAAINLSARAASLLRPLRHAQSPEEGFKIRAIGPGGRVEP